MVFREQPVFSARVGDDGDGKIRRERAADADRTESKETLDAFVAAMKSVLEEARTSPELVKGAPYSTPVRRLDDVKAARELDLKWSPA